MGADWAGFIVAVAAFLVSVGALLVSFLSHRAQKTNSDRLTSIEEARRGDEVEARDLALASASRADVRPSEMVVLARGTNGGSQQVRMKLVNLGPAPATRIYLGERLSPRRGPDEPMLIDRDGTKSEYFSVTADRAVTAELAAGQETEVIYFTYDTGLQHGINVALSWEDGGGHRFAESHVPKTELSR
ncbi:hypothetical protein SAMN05428970_2379 [Agromyces sp. CF514]|uniref:hypothetical protein n=1 Tax=Agromyces sp. CF514 TaxID=1881031 RepID=UPI0008E620A4|nr:hypothetical protein [Agromyces sp. CF514]SFR78408.1 hypothetical protein SAMN05428970_2379 [Agromyces sp. CF514]